MIIDTTQTKVERYSANMQQELRDFYYSLPRTRGPDGRYFDDYNEVLYDTHFVPCSECQPDFSISYLRFYFGLELVSPEFVFSQWEENADSGCKRCGGVGYNRLAVGESDE